MIREMTHTQIKEKFEEIGLRFDLTDPKFRQKYYKCRSALLLHPRENRLHWQIKSMFFYEFLRKGFTVFTEFPINKAIVDLFVLDNAWDIEIETHLQFNYKELQRAALQNRNLNLWVVPAQDFKASFRDGREKWLQKFGLWEKRIVREE